MWSIRWKCSCFMISIYIFYISYKTMVKAKYEKRKWSLPGELKYTWKCNLSLKVSLNSKRLKSKIMCDLPSSWVKIDFARRVMSHNTNRTVIFIKKYGQKRWWTAWKNWSFQSCQRIRSVFDKFFTNLKIHFM